MGSLIRDNKALLKKLARGIYNISLQCVCQRLLDGGMDIILPFTNDSIVIHLLIEKEDIEFVEVKNDVYVCLNIDKMCNMNRATFTMCGGMIGSHVYTDCKPFGGFFDDYFFYGVEKYIRDDFNTFMNGNSKVYTFDTYLIVLEYLVNKTNYPINLDTVSNGDTFNSIIQYVIDNNMVDDVISYMKDITYDFLYESFDTYLKSKTVFTLSKDSYYENGLLGVVKVDFKNLKYIAFDGVSTYDKITFSKSSNKICGGDLDYVFNGRIEYLGNVVRSSIKICKAPGVNRYTGKLVGVSGLLSHKSFELSAHWRGVW